MTNNDDLALELREAAESATKGSWRRTSTEFNGICVGPFSFTKEQVLARAVEKRDAIFISVANPENILALLAERDADKKRIEMLEKYVDERDAQNQDLLLNIGSLQQRIAELETVCAESYQVVGALADAAGVFETSEAVSKALDNLSYAKLTHEDVLPFAVEARTVSVKLPEPATEGGRGYRQKVIWVLKEALFDAGINLEVGE